MFRRSWSIAASLIVCLTWVLVGPTLSVQSQTNVDEVIITDVTAESRSGDHPLVKAYLSVLDDQNQHVSGLRRSDFAVKEFTESVSDISLDTERQGVAVEFLVDVSGSMEAQGQFGTKLEDVQQAVGQATGRMVTEDQAGVFTFSKIVEEKQPLGSARDVIVPTFEVPTDPELQYTCIYDAAWRAVEDLTSKDVEQDPQLARMKKAIFVFSDGQDSGLAQCNYEVTDVKKLLLARDPSGKISVYAIGVGPEQGDNFRDLQNLARITEGQFIHYYGEGAQAGLGAAYDGFLTQGEQYLLSYGTQACADQVTLQIGVGGATDDVEVSVPPTAPVISLNAPAEEQPFSNEVPLQPDIVLEQCPIREVTFYVNGQKMETMAAPFEWIWDTTTYPDTHGANPSEQGVIEDISIRAEAVDQKGLTGEDTLSGVSIKIDNPTVELTKVENPHGSTGREDILVTQNQVERHGRWGDRDKCNEIEPTELTIGFNVNHSSGERREQRVDFIVDGEVIDSLSRPPAQYDLDISSWGCNPLQPGEHHEGEHKLTVVVQDDLGLTAETETWIRSDTYVKSFWQMIGDALKNQLSNWLPISLAVLGIALGVYVWRVGGTRQAIDQMAVGVRKVTEFLGVVSKGTRIVLVEEEKDVRPYALRDVTNLGRDETRADIAFDNPAVSRVHAALVKEDEDFIIYDQGSKNGTWVNGRRLPFKGHAVLETGDMIELGRGGVELRFEREAKAEDNGGRNS